MAVKSTKKCPNCSSKSTREMAFKSINATSITKHLVQIEDLKSYSKYYSINMCLDIKHMQI